MCPLAGTNILILSDSIAPHSNAAGFEFGDVPQDDFQMSIGICVDRLRSLVALLVSLLKSVAD